MKISTARLKQIIKEELFYREFHRETKGLAEGSDEETVRGDPRATSRQTEKEVAPPLTSTLRDLDLERRIRAYIEKMEAQGKPLSIAGTTNPWEQSDEPEKLKTHEWTPKDFEEFMKRKKS